MSTQIRQPTRAAVRTYTMERWRRGALAFIPNKNAVMTLTQKTHGTRAEMS